MEPDLMEVGSSLEEARALRREHDELLYKLGVREHELLKIWVRGMNYSTGFG